MKGSSDDVRGSVAAIGDSAVHAAAGRGDDIHSSSGVEGLAPITGELRETIRSLAIDDSVLTIGGDDFHRLCDAIDAVHAGLERENAELRERVAELEKRGDSMHDGGSITGELREWWVRKFPVMDKKLHKNFTAIADRIDAEHQKAEDEWKAKDGQTWLKGYAECHAELMEGNEAIAESLEKAGWVKLTVDVDGETIHIGDEMVLQHEAAEKPYTVQSLTWDGEDWYFTCDEGFFNACGWMHHRAPTVEDVLREFGIDWEYEDNCEDRAALLAEYAAKLRLAEGEDA